MTDTWGQSEGEGRGRGEFGRKLVEEERGAESEGDQSRKVLAKKEALVSASGVEIHPHVRTLSFLLFPAAAARRVC